MVCVLAGPRKKKVPEHSLTGILIVKITRVAGARSPWEGVKPTPDRLAKATQWSVVWLLALEITAA